MKNKYNHKSMAPHFNDAESAREFLEKMRWSEKPICPHCGSVSDHYALTPKPNSMKPVRKGVWKCKDCREQFTVTIGTIFEGSKIPLNKWLFAIYLLCTSKKGISAHQLHRMLDITYKSAWFMAHRIRYAMKETGLSEKFKGIVEADETYIGGKPRKGDGQENKRGRGTKKTPVFALVERNGRVMSQPVEHVTSVNLKSIIRENVATEAIIMTDDFKSYRGLGKEFYKHKVINHSKKQYVKGNIHTNTIEGYFSLLKRGITGIYHHVDKHHLHRYLDEFDFRYNTREISDTERAMIALKGIEGKRLTYRDSSRTIN